MSHQNDQQSSSNQQQQPQTTPHTPQIPVISTTTPIAQHVANLASEAKDYIVTSMNNIDESTATKFKVHVGHGEKQSVIDPKSTNESANSMAEIH